MNVPDFVLAIDHRNSLRQWYRTVTGASTADSEALRAGKVVVADGLLRAVGDDSFRAGSGSGSGGQAMLLVDDEYGTDAIKHIRSSGARVRIVVPAERSGEQEFSFEHGSGFGAHVAETGPDIVKALVRYNPGGDASRNGRSRSRLTELSRWLDEHDLPLMLELLVPPTPDQASDSFDREVRPELTLRAIAELRDAGLDPAWWKVEGQPSTAHFTELAKAAGGRCLVLGRGEDADAVGRWVAMAAAAEGFSGFAVGRTIWSRPLAGWLTGQVKRADAVAAVAENYLRFVQIYLNS